MWMTRGLAAAAVLTLSVGCGGGAGEQARDPNQANPNAMADSAAPGSDAARAANANTGGDQQEFLQHAMAGGQAEVQLAQMAQQKATSPGVKQLAQRIQQDHEQANRELMPIAQQMGVTPPAQMPGEMRDAHEQLTQASGQDFDRRYVEMMIEHHEKDIEEFEEASGRAQGQLKAFVDKTLPVLREHLQLAQAQRQQTTNRR